MVHCTDEDTSELVIILIPDDFPAICKCYLLVPAALHLRFPRAHVNCCL
jgi:hypothetical protein